MKNEKEISVLVRFKTEQERHKWKMKCVKKGLSYKDSIMDWVNG
jgi:hypothetical protein